MVECGRSGINGVVGAWGVGLGVLGETAFGNGQGSNGLFGAMRFGWAPGSGSSVGRGRVPPAEGTGLQLLQPA